MSPQPESHCPTCTDSQTPLRLSRRSTLVSAGTLVGALGLAGCSGAGGGGSAEQSPDYTQGSASLEVEIPPEIDGPIYPEGYAGPRLRDYSPFYSGDETFTVLTRSAPGNNLKTNAFSAFLEEQTGVTVDYQTVPMGDDGTTKVNAIISSGDLPDAFMLGPEWMGGFSPSELYVYGEQGLFQPLDKLIDKWAPELQQHFSQFSDFRPALTAPNGRMYAFPTINQCFHCRSASARTWVNKNWLAEIGADAGPTNTDELREVLREFAGRHPEGKAFSGYKEELPIEFFASAFLNPGIDFLRKNGEAVEYTPVLDEFREALRYIRSLVDEGLVDPNLFTQTSEQFQRLTMHPDGNRVGFAHASAQGWLATDELSKPESVINQFIIQQPIDGPNRKATIPWKYDAGAFIGLVITQACKDPETLVRWADFQMSLMSTLSMRLGPFEKAWTWAKEGTTGIDGKQAMYERIPQTEESSKKLKNTSWDEWGPFSLSMDVRHAEAVDATRSVEPALYEAGTLYEQWASPEDEYFAQPFYTTDQAAEIGEYATNISTITTRYITDFSIGRAEIDDDAAWKQFTSELENAGLSRYLDVQAEASKASS